MKLKAHLWLFTTATLSLGVTAAVSAGQVQPSTPERIRVSIDAQKTAPPVSKYIYGGFIEHIGTLMYRGLWSEMIDDRKFYFSISSNDAPPADGAAPRLGRMPLRKWRPIGPDEAIAMDNDRPFVGDHSPKIELEGATPHGIRQSGLTLVKGKQYTGRIYLRGTPGSRAKITLSWGPGENESQTVAIPALTADY